jgi:hypothetical protein
VLPVMMDMRLRLLRVVIERRGWCRMRSIGERKRSSITGRKAAAGGKKSSAEKRKPGLVQSPEAVYDAQKDQQNKGVTGPLGAAASISLVSLGGGLRRVVRVEVGSEGTIVWRRADE